MSSHISFSNINNKDFKLNAENYSEQKVMPLLRTGVLSFGTFGQMASAPSLVEREIVQVAQPSCSSSQTVESEASSSDSEEEYSLSQEKQERKNQVELQIREAQAKGEFLTPSIYREAATLCEMSGDLKGAAEHYDQGILSFGKESISGRIYRGIFNPITSQTSITKAYFCERAARLNKRLGEYQKAIAYCQMCIESDKNEGRRSSIFILYRMAGSYMKIGDYKNAIETYEKILNRRNNFFPYKLAALYFSLGRAYLKCGNLKKAKASFYQAIWYGDKKIRKKFVRLYEEENLKVPIFFSLKLIQCADTYKEELTYLAKMIESSRKKFGDQIPAFLCYEISQVFSSKGRFKDAINYCQMALDGYNSEDYKRIKSVDVSLRIIDIYDDLSFFYDELGNEQEAAFYRQFYRQKVQALITS